MFHVIQIKPENAENNLKGIAKLNYPHWPHMDYIQSINQGQTLNGLIRTSFILCKINKLLTAF